MTATLTTVDLRCDRCLAVGRFPVELRPVGETDGGTAIYTATVDANALSAFIYAHYGPFRQVG